MTPHNRNAAVIIKTGGNGEDTKLDLKNSSWQLVFFELRDARTSGVAPLGHLFRAGVGPGTFDGPKASLPDGRDRNAGTGAPWDDGGSVLRQ